MGPAGIALQSTLMPLASKAFLTSEQSRGGDGAGADADEDAPPSSELRHCGSSAKAAVSAVNTLKCIIVTHSHNLESHAFWLS